MRIDSLLLENFRNIRQGSLTPGPGVNLIYGDNAQGKTNLVESIWLLSGERSFRYGRESDIPRLEMDRGTERSRILAAIRSEGREQEIEYILHPRRQIRLNGIVLPGRSALSGKLCCVVFSPTHLSLIKDGPSGRRDFLDGAICQLRPQYSRVLADYQRALTQRGSLLRDIPRNRYLEEMLDIWDSHIVRLGGLILTTRYSYLRRLEGFAAEFHRGISSGQEELELRYAVGGAGEEIDPGADRESVGEMLRAALLHGRQEDIRTGSTGVGPHRDDLDIRINGISARSFASQGQQRSAVLSLKLAACEMIRDTAGSHPVALPDDAMGGLDRSRRACLLGRMEGRQVFITACDDSLLRETDTAGLFHVDGGVITPMH